LTAEELVTRAFADTPQLIVYHLNDMGEVSRIETALDISKSKVVPEGVFHRNETLQTRLRTYFNGWCGGRYYTPTSCFILNVPSDKSLEDKYYYSVTGNGYLPAGTEIYDADQFGFIEGLFVYNNDSEQELSGGDIKLIADIETTLDANDETIIKLIDQDGGAYTVKPEKEASQTGGWGLIESQKKHNVKTAADLMVGDIVVTTASLGFIDAKHFIIR